MFKKISGRVLITVIGVLLILYSLSTVLLGIAGNDSIAVITDVRREGGELPLAKSGKYMYNMSYTFEIPNGDVFYGYSKEVSDGAYIKNPNTVAHVKYFKSIPHFNALEKDTKFSAGKLILVVFGLSLIIIVNRKE
ncbi:MAG: hypothetical protein K0Q47_708 [Sedimentibacter sp.]|jgi:hypothetical protein|nr:hypothetical protein [Sedimentibacter sp.]